MIYNRTLNDETQKKVLQELRITEKLISKVATKLSAVQKDCNIYAMSDLGIAHNITRMRGGFFTGAVYQWEETDIPFIPIDATVNVCGTALYHICSEISVDEIREKCENALEDTTEYCWNFMHGNHFISLCHVGEDYDNIGMKRGYYMLVHASACEYKDQLYPIRGNWYYDSIQTETLGEYRYLRFIKGKKAERFYQMAKMLESFNRERNHFFCKHVLHNKMGREILNVSHYGMPSISEILIGVQKTDELATLLTSPGKPIYVVKKKEKSENYYIPHGFGLELLQGSKLVYHEDCLEIGGKLFTSGGIGIGKDAINRHGSSETEESLRKYVRNIAQINGLEICAELKQICSFSANGFKVWR